MLRFLPSPVFIASAIGVALAVNFGQGWLDVSPPSSPVVQAAEVTATTHTLDLPTRRGPNESGWVAMIERPLFSETRRPAIYVEEIYDETEPPPEPDVSESDLEPEFEPPPPEPPRVAFLGVISESDARRALLRFESNGQERWFGLGASIDGWQLVQINSDVVRFLSNGEEFSVPLRR